MIQVFKYDPRYIVLSYMSAANLLPTDSSGSVPLPSQFIVLRTRAGRQKTGKLLFTAR